MELEKQTRARLPYINVVFVFHFLRLQDGKSFQCPSRITYTYRSEKMSPFLIVLVSLEIRYGSWRTSDPFLTDWREKKNVYTFESHELFLDRRRDFTVPRRSRIKYHGRKNNHLSSTLRAFRYRCLVIVRFHFFDCLKSAILLRVSMQIVYFYKYIYQVNRVIKTPISI